MTCATRTVSAHFHQTFIIILPGMMHPVTPLLVEVAMDILLFVRRIIGPEALSSGFTLTFELYLQNIWIKIGIY